MDRVQPHLSTHSSCILDRHFTSDEVRVAAFSIAPTKAPGLDGLPGLFYHKFRDLVGPKVTAECLRCLNDGGSLEAVNGTLVVLIPKVKNPVRITEFRPISLCNVIYKIVAKVIANRLLLVLDEVISNSQSAFIPGRLIADNALIGFECLYAIQNQKRNVGSFALKLDMSKAYDRVEWDFLALMMGKLGFSSQWIDKVMNCVSTVCFSFAINGEVCGSVKPSRGLRQGCPLSPYLFLLCAKSLSSVINAVVRDSSLSGFQCKRAGPTISHLFFADDSLLFSKATDRDCTNI
ncbi:hypothetical protein LWI29_011174 [Acer saccharum]|uniref:Reverse transcriptase domain-containing protein n=1 Tax=Acer saccharum TaxID=4024 RepID=A0AA39S6Q7_ACESA|nr:hypothetical protein LWI29_011174 [Acer saccharum]